MLSVANHVEQGARSFHDVAQQLSVDLEMEPAAFADCLPSWYLGVQAVRLAAGQDTGNLDTLDAERAIVAAASLQR